MIELLAKHEIVQLSGMSIFAIGFFLGCVFCTTVAGWIWMSFTKGTKRKPSDVQLLREIIHSYNQKPIITQAEKDAYLMKYIRNATRNSTDNPSQ